MIAFIAEPVVGATTGCVTALPGYFRRVREICDRHGALLILDEVMCGMGRTGTMHAWEQEGIAPDLQVVAKGLGGGYQPIGGVLIGGRVVDASPTAPAASCTATPTRRIPSPARPGPAVLPPLCTGGVPQKAPFMKVGYRDDRCWGDRAGGLPL